MAATTPEEVGGIREEARLLLDYLRAVKSHWAALSGGALVLCSKWLAEAGSHVAGQRVDLMVPGWVYHSGWLLVASAQYLAWRDAWQRRGTAEKPYLSKGLRIDHITRTVEPTLRGPVPSLSVVMEGKLDGDFQVFFDRSVTDLKLHLRNQEKRTWALEFPWLDHFCTHAFRVKAHFVEGAVQVIVRVRSAESPNLIRAEVIPLRRRPWWQRQSWWQWRRRPHTGPSAVASATANDGPSDEAGE